MEALLDCVISVPPRVKWSESNGEILFFDGEREQIFGLDYVGADAFLRLARREPLAKVIDDLLREYAVERSVLERDLTQLLNALRDQGIIQIERPSG
jgi:Coenzyme PQQ synthesis protein D (PqqD)